MRDVEKYEDPIQFRPEYSWPDPGTAANCPHCGESMQLIDPRPEYFGKPWWCSTCQWQFSQEDLAGHKTSVETNSDS
ncbi:MAG: hypothetical protein GXO90_09435 [FCB group bacterium]|nr:hypothetical protein [FCB group bacterium]